MVYIKNKRNSKTILKSIGLELEGGEIKPIKKRDFYKNFGALKQDSNASRIKVVKKIAYNAYKEQMEKQPIEQKTNTQQSDSEIAQNELEQEKQQNNSEVEQNNSEEVKQPSESKATQNKTRTAQSKTKTTQNKTRATQSKSKTTQNKTKTEE